MGMGKRFVNLAGGLAFIAFAGCQNADITAPGDGDGDVSLTTAEIAAMSGFLMNGAFDGWDFGQAGGGGAGASLLSGAPISIDYAVTVANDCPMGGTLSVSGAITGTIDDQTFTGDLDVGLTTSASACSFLHDQTTITVDTNPDLVLDGSFAFDQGQLVGEALFTYVGTVGWSTDDGRSGSCTYDVLVTATNDGSLTQNGTVCETSL
jgi:hypothetical protein